MPISFSNDRFVVQYSAGDAKGNSFSNPYTFEEIYQFALTQGLGYVTKISNTYHFQKGIYFAGASTYFLGAGVNVLFYNLAISAKILDISSCNFRLGGTSTANAYNCMISGVYQYGYQIYAIGLNVEIRNTFMHYVRVRSLQGVGGNIKIANCMVNGDSNTFEAGFSNNTKELDFMSFHGNTTVNNNVTLPKFDNCFFRDTSSLYTQLPGTSVNRKLKFLDSSYINFVMNSYANGDSHNKYLIDCNSNVTVNASSNSSIAYTAFYNVFFQTSLKINLNTQANIRIYDKDSNLVKQYNAVSAVDDVITYKTVICYSPALSSQVVKTTNVKQPFRFEFEPISSDYQSASISNYSITEEVESVIKLDFKASPAALTFSIRRLLSRIFASGKPISSSELVTEGAIEHEAQLDEEATITNAARATYRPSTNDILIEQQIDGLFTESEVISEGVELIRGSASIIDDPDPIYIDQRLRATISDPEHITATVRTSQNIKATIT
jgi:hypothetical protein